MILAHFLSACQAFLSTFFDFFGKLFCFLSTVISATRLCLRQLMHYIISCFRLSTVFRAFFQVFSDFFSKPCRTCFDCPVRFGQLVYPITNGFICQLFFGTFFRFFPIFFQTGFSSSQGPSLRQLAYIITLYRPCQLFLCLFCHYF